MVLSTRERRILIATFATFGLLILYYVVISPDSAYMRSRDEMLARQKTLSGNLQTARDTIDRRNRIENRWKSMVQSGLKNEPAEAESQVLHAVQDWSDQAGIKLSLQKPERSAEKTRLPEIKFQVNGTGTMKALVNLLWHIQTATIPIKVAELKLDSHKEGEDDLMFTLNLSTVYSPPPKLSSAGPKPNTSGGAR